MELMLVIYSSLFLAIAIPAAYFPVRAWRRRNTSDTADRGSGFRPRIGFSRLDGMESLSLLLANESQDYVWVEEIEIFLTGLHADDQTAEASLHEIQKIR